MPRKMTNIEKKAADVLASFYRNIPFDKLEIETPGVAGDVRTIIFALSDAGLLRSDAVAQRLGKTVGW